MTQNANVKRLIEQNADSSFQILNEAEEVVTPGGKKLHLMKVGGIFGEAERPTGNKRRYRRPILAEGIKNLQHMIETRQCLGELDHPDDGRTRLQRVSHLITKLELREDNTVYGEAIILNTDQGRNLKALFEAGIKVGCSSRGFGETELAADGFEDVKPGYQLNSYDFVFQPASPQAFPAMLPESMQHVTVPQLFESMESVLQQPQGEAAKPLPKAPVLTKAAAQPVVLAPIAPAAPAISVKEMELQKKIEALELELGESRAAAHAMAENYRSALATAAASMKDKAQTESNNVLLQIAKLVAPLVTPRDIKEAQQAAAAEQAQLELSYQQIIEQYESEKRLLMLRAEKAEALAMETGYRLYLAQTLGDSPDIGLYNQMLGDLAQYESLDALEKRVSAIQTEIEKAREAERQKEKIFREAVEAQRAADQQTIAALQARLQEVQGRITESVQTQVVQEESAQNRLALYAERRISSSPDPVAAREALYGRTVYNESEIDALLESVGIGKPNPMTIAEKLRAAQKRGITTTTMNEEVAPAPNAPTLRLNRASNVTPADLAGLGLHDLNEVNRLAGDNPPSR